MNRTQWVERAKCKDMDPRWFETDGWLNNRTSQADRVVRASTLCSGCSVVRECAADALEPLAIATIRAGVWIDANPVGRPRKTIREKLHNIALGLVNHGD